MPGVPLKANSFAISLPFTINTSGRIDDTSDPTKIWDDRVRAVLLTTQYERINNFEFGSTIYDELLQGSNAAVDSAEEGVKKAIAEAFTKFLPALVLKGVSTTFNNSTGSMTVNLEYALPSTATSELNINVISMNGTTPPQITNG